MANLTNTSNAPDLESMTNEKRIKFIMDTHNSLAEELKLFAGQYIYLNMRTKEYAVNPDAFVLHRTAKTIIKNWDFKYMSFAMIGKNGEYQIPGGCVGSPE